MRLPNTDTARNMPVTLPCKQLLIRYAVASTVHTVTVRCYGTRWRYVCTHLYRHAECDDSINCSVGWQIITEGGRPCQFALSPVTLDGVGRGSFLGGGEGWSRATVPGGRVQGAAKLIFQVKTRFLFPTNFKLLSQIKENLIHFLKFIMYIGDSHCDCLCQEKKNN
jgi:hypothetical protein